MALQLKHQVSITFLDIIALSFLIRDCLNSQNDVNSTMLSEVKNRLGAELLVFLPSQRETQHSEC